MQKASIHFNYSGVRFSLPDRTGLKIFVARIFKREGVELEGLRYIFCTDEELRQMNVQWLGHETYTDIITFDLSSDSHRKSGEVYISIERVRENAGIYNTGFAEELKRVIFHGALHLCGYKDKTRGQKEEMRIAEEKYLKLYNSST